MNKRLTFPAAAALAAAILPLVALAQTDMPAAVPMDNASNTIGLLVAWLLAGGGIITAIICMGVDRTLRAKR
ncbi:MAG: hypothetical protein IAI50_02920 [Candidatus Eremiobacteraeota bacterium]|nr:hypothetical protein [Candidatus Eremiobacteraeota bacterium]